MSNVNSALALQALCAVPSRHPAPLCRAQKLVALRFTRPDPVAASRFFIDFGLTLVRQDDNHVLLRGAGSDTACIIIERGPAAYVAFSLALDPTRAIPAVHWTNPQRL